MDSSRRAVEAYWRSRTIDGVTADEEKIAPVYKLEEICELLRTSDGSIVKEVTELILKRLEHKSPIVKQKALRLIKYAVGKSGAEFRREMQRHSAAMRQLLHYKGQLDSLKGDALNKAVRDMAQDAISALFTSDENKSTTPVESINKRIEGFGNTNYEMPVEEKKSFDSFLSEVVGLGSASIIQGLTSLATSHTLKKNDNGTYRSPNLRRSLTTEMDSRDRYEPVHEHHGESWHSSVSSRDAASGSWNPESRNYFMNTSANEENTSTHMVVRNREERFLDTIVTSGGVRLQPTRDALQAFLTETSKFDSLAMSRAIEMKLQSHMWQVRMKAMCVLESILRKTDDDHCSIIASYFSENSDTVAKCCELPQASLREKANKVLSLLGAGDQHFEAGNERGSTNGKLKPVPAVQVSDLISTDDTDEASAENLVDEKIEDLTSPPLFIDDLFGSAPISDETISRKKNDDDPFADVSFHMADEDHKNIFSGLTVDKKPDIMSHTDDLMSGLSLSGPNQDNLQSGASGIGFQGSAFFGSNAYNSMDSMQYKNMQPNVMFNPGFAAQSMNYGAMGAFIAQQQLLFQNMGNNINSGYGNAAGIGRDGGLASPLPDIFHLSNNAVQSHTTMMSSNSKKDETKAFDFISDHMSAARDSKRIH